MKKVIAESFELSSLRELISETELPLEAMVAVSYHDMFGYPLSSIELNRWLPGKRAVISVKNISEVSERRGFFYAKGRGESITLRLLRGEFSRKKMEIAKRAANLLGLLPSVKMVGVTGALAMDNADEESDIDLMIVTKGGLLWITRAIVIILLKLGGFKLRRFGKKKQRDKLCLNIWLDEKDLAWNSKRRNIFTAHEIAQIVPLVNIGQTYERFLYKNKWIKDYWPNAVEVKKVDQVNQAIKLTKLKKNFLINLINQLTNLLLCFMETVAYKMQYMYMKEKITREIVTPTRALFHPNDWSDMVLSRLK